MWASVPRVRCSVAPHQDAPTSPPGLPSAEQLAPTVHSPFATGHPPFDPRLPPCSGAAPPLAAGRASPVYLPVAANLSAAFDEEAQQQAAAALDPPVSAAAVSVVSTPPSAAEPPLCTTPVKAALNPTKQRRGSPGSPQVTAHLLTPPPPPPHPSCPPAAAPDGIADAALAWPLPPLASSPQQPSADTVTATPPRAQSAATAGPAGASPLEVCSEDLGVTCANRPSPRRRVHSCPNPKVPPTGSRALRARSSQLNANDADFVVLRVRA